MPKESSAEPKGQDKRSVGSQTLRFPQVIPLVHCLRPSLPVHPNCSLPSIYLYPCLRISPCFLGSPLPTSGPPQCPSLGCPSPDYNPQAPPARGAAHAPCSPPPPLPLPPFLLTSLRPPPPRLGSRIPPSNPVPQPHRHRSLGRAQSAQAPVSAWPQLPAPPPRTLPAHPSEV